MRLDLVEDVEVCNETDDYQLPLELQPVPQDDGLPNDELRDGWTIHNDSGEGSDWDALDIKNLPDWKPDQDPEQDLFTDDVYAWVRRGEQETLCGTRPRLYTRLDIPNGDGVNLNGKEPDILPITEKGASTLAPYLFVQQIPAKRGIPQVERDGQFAHMFYRYAYLQLHEHYRRVSCFRQDDPSLPRFLLIQEFTDLYDDYQLKKQEAEYWWRQNGWEGVIPEFFEIRKAK
ncbi:MAG: hypothetical protein Q9226_003860 [Calogaya cf. arnoldii]